MAAIGRHHEALHISERLHRAADPHGSSTCDRNGEEVNVSTRWVPSGIEELGAVRSEGAAPKSHAQADLRTARDRHAEGSSEAGGEDHMRSVGAEVRIGGATWGHAPA